MQTLDRNEFEHIIAVITQENVKIWEQLYKKNQQIAGLLEYKERLKNLLRQNTKMYIDELTKNEELRDYSEYGNIIPYESENVPF
jgi:ABC-type glutathione transport system ATPase component